MRAALAALLLLQAVGGRARSPRAAPSFVAAPHAHLSKDLAPARRRPALPFCSARRAGTYGLQHLRGVSRDDNLRRADHVTEATNCDAPLRRRAEVRPRRRLIRRRRPAQGAAPGAVCVRTTSPASRGPAKLRGSPAAAAARPQHASNQSRTAESLLFFFYLPPLPTPPRLTQPSAQASSPKRRERAHVHNDHSQAPEGPPTKLPTGSLRAKSGGAGPRRAAPRARRAARRRGAGARRRL